MVALFSGKSKANKPGEPAEEVVKVPSKEPAIAQVPLVKKHQYELSEGDLEVLGKGMWGKAAWKKVAMRHGFNPDTLEELPPIFYTDNATKLVKEGPKAFLAVPKDWSQELVEERKKQILSGKRNTDEINFPSAVANPEPGTSRTEEVEV